MKNVLATISYNGRLFNGFQRQPDKRTVQGELEKTLSYMLGRRMSVHGAGRTDKGVHALGQAVTFLLPVDKDLEAFRKSLNRVLPPDIVILSLKEVPEDFDARHSSAGKVYRYIFSWGDKDPLQEGLRTELGLRDFNVSAFKEALSYFVGTHDFSNYTTKSEDNADFIRTIDEISVEADEERRVAVVTFKGNGFMTYMIRFMMGTAFHAGRGKIEPKDVIGLLNRKPRSIVPYKAKADGLYLVKVIYEEEA
ncbi:MAG: tRNA pseudouridine(38-40) synthase TruA [Bacilli bacterium]|nr:tRNA pseudouridine(38-40) synthase TruA [Bacilli bacterium]